MQCRSKGEFHKFPAGSDSRAGNSRQGLPLWLRSSTGHHRSTPASIKTSVARLVLGRELFSRLNWNGGRLFDRFRVEVNPNVEGNSPAVEALGSLSEFVRPAHAKD